LLHHAGGNYHPLIWTWVIILAVYGLAAYWLRR
jgi:hypothetical protein